MDDAQEKQLDFLGDNISKCIFSCMTQSSPVTIEKQGLEFGLNVFVIGQYKASKVSDAENRQLSWLLNPTESTALVRFRRELQIAAASWEQKTPNNRIKAEF